MFNITNTTELINVCSNLEKSSELNTFPVEIIFNVQALQSDTVELFAKYFQHISKITNNNFFIKLIINDDDKVLFTKLTEAIEKLKVINMQNNLKCLLIKNYYTKDVERYFTTGGMLNQLNYLHDFEFEDLWYDYTGETDVNNPATYFINLIHDFCKQHKNIQSCRVINFKQYLNNDFKRDSAQKAYSALQNTLKENAATLDKLENCIEKINSLAKDLNIYNERLQKKESSDTVRKNDKEQYDKISERIKTTKIEFSQYADTLITKNNTYVYYYLAKYQTEIEQNIDPKQIFEHLEKITLPLESDTEKNKHADLYYKAKMWQANICCNLEQYAQVKGLNLNMFTKDNNGNYILPKEIEAERMKLVIKYALEAKQESDTFLENTLQEYILGNFVSSDNNDFAGINSKDKNTFDVIWQLVEAFKKYVEQHKKETQEQAVQTDDSLLIFRGRQLTPIAAQQTEPELEETNACKRQRISRSASPMRNYTL